MCWCEIRFGDGGRSKFHFDAEFWTHGDSDGDMVLEAYAKNEMNCCDMSQT